MDKKTFTELSQIILSNSDVPPCVIDDILDQIQAEINDTLTANSLHYKSPLQVLDDYGIPHKYLSAFVTLNNPF